MHCNETQTEAGLNSKCEVVDHNRQSLEGKDNKNESVKCANIHQSIHQNYNHIDCYFCGDKFESKRFLMEHKKRLHIEKATARI